MNREELETSIEELGILYKRNIISKDQFTEYVKMALNLFVQENFK